MVRRFSRLRYANKAIQTPSENDAIVQAPTGSILENFNKFQSGSANISYPRTATSRTGGLSEVSVNPFGLPLLAANNAIVPISNRVDGAGADVQNVITASGHTAVDTDTNKRLEGFKPAVAILSIPSGSTSTTPVTSQITGIDYLPSNRVTYTVPYGAKTGKTTESEVRDDILTAVNAITNGKVTFRSEKF